MVLKTERIVVNNDNQTEKVNYNTLVGLDLIFQRHYSTHKESFEQKEKPAFLDSSEHFSSNC